MSSVKFSWKLQWLLNPTCHPGKYDFFPAFFPALHRVQPSKCIYGQLEALLLLQNGYSLEWFYNPKLSLWGTSNEYHNICFCVFAKFIFFFFFFFAQKLYFVLKLPFRPKRVRFSGTAASVQKVSHIWFFFNGKFFPTHENTWHWILLAYLRIISNQIAI